MKELAGTIVRLQEGHVVLQVHAQYTTRTQPTGNSLC